jgi:hypothetical protein
MTTPHVQADRLLGSAAQARTFIAGIFGQTASDGLPVFINHQG